MGTPAENGYFRQLALQLSQRPFLSALLVSVLFIGLSLVYIIVSDWLVLRIEPEPEAMARIQTMKGAGYVLLVGLVTFGMIYLFLRLLRGAIGNQVAAARAMVAADKLATAGTMAASVAHDIRNMLTSLTLSHDIEGESRAGGSEGADLSRRIIDQIASLSERLMVTGGMVESSGMMLTDPEPLIEDACRMARPHGRRSGCVIESRTEPDIGPVRVIPGVILQMLVNLLVNAVAAAGDHGRVRVTASGRQRDLVLTVEDDGPGVPVELRSKLLREPFTTKSDGHGLGLLSVRAAAQLHDGDVSYRVSELGGALFECRLPVRRGEAGE